jgi:hypothetical protein
MVITAAATVASSWSLNSHARTKDASGRKESINPLRSAVEDFTPSNRTRPRRAPCGCRARSALQRCPGASWRRPPRQELHPGPSCRSILLSWHVTSLFERMRPAMRRAARMLCLRCYARHCQSAHDRPGPRRDGERDLPKLVFTILSAVAEAEHDRIRERVAPVKQDRKHRGRYLVGKDAIWVPGWRRWWPCGRCRRTGADWPTLAPCRQMVPPCTRFKLFPDYA